MKALFARAGSQLWAALNGAAERALRRGWIRPTQLPCRVISVGNIQAGGAGKTPLVAAIANEAISRGHSVAILCRGYRGRWEREGGVISPHEKAPPSGVCGDEAALLRDLVPGAWIGVGADRAASFARCCEVAAQKGERAIELVVLDDGFQHRRIRKDVEVVALTSRGSGEVLFREHANALARAQLLVWTKGEREPAGLRSAGVPWVRVRYRLQEPSFREPVLLVTGIADGTSAREELERAGYEIRMHKSFVDHASYGEAQVEFLLRVAADQGLRVLMTGKDWVKWRDLGIRRGTASGEVFVIEPELVFEMGRENWERVLWANI